MNVHLQSLTKLKIYTITSVLCELNNTFNIVSDIKETGHETDLPRCSNKFHKARGQDIHIV